MSHEVIVRAESVSVVFYRRTKGYRSLRNLVLESGKRLPKKEPFHALRDLSFDVRAGEVLGIIGRNGAGKSTLMRLIGGIFSPDTGSIEVSGRVSTLLSLGAGFELELSGLDNIYINGLLLGLPKEEISRVMDEIIEFSELEEFILEPLKTYSSGMMARLGFAISIHTHSDIMLVDEVLGVGDKDFREKSKTKIREIIRDNRTVILVSHGMSDILQFSDRVLWIERGEAIAFGDPEETVELYMASEKPKAKKG